MAILYDNDFATFKMLHTDTLHSRIDLLDLLNVIFVIKVNVIPLDHPT